MTEKMSRSLLNGVWIHDNARAKIEIWKGASGIGSWSRSPGFFGCHKVPDAVEAAEKRTLAATGQAVAGVLSQRFGGSAGEATQDVFATAGHAVGTAWNLFEIRKAISSSSSVSSSLLKNAVKNRKT